MSPPGGGTAPGYVSLDRGADEDPPRRRRRKSPSDLRREARRIGERQDKAREDRGEFWNNRITDPMLAARIERRERLVEADKRDLRQDFFKRLPDVDPGAGVHVNTAQYRKDR